MKNNKDVTTRFLEVVKELKVSCYTLHKHTDISKAAIYQVKNGSNNVTMNIIVPFLTNYPQVNFNYILTGRGNMLEENLHDKLVMAEHMNDQLHKNIESLEKELKKEKHYSDLVREKIEDLTSKK